MPSPRRSRPRLQSLDNYDWLALILVFILSLLGLVLIFNASHADAYVQFGDKFRYLKLQLLWLALGLVALAVTSRLPLAFVQFASPYFMGLVLLLLVIVLIPGLGSEFMGARRWLSIGNLVIQPSELAKLALVLFLPSLIQRRNFLPGFMIILGLTSGLILIEPDLGTTLIVLAIGFGIYFLAGASLIRLVPFLAVMIAITSLTILSTPYRLERVKTFFNPHVNPQGASYHVRQIMIALGSGGFTGTGLGQSRQKFQYLPEATTDSIFAVIGEETGFIGSFTLVVVFFGFCLRLLRRTALILDPYRRLVGAGITVWFIAQIVINLAAMVVLIPLTGVPLPFISYGGSALLSAMVGIGFYLNASRLPAKTDKHTV